MPCTTFHINKTVSECGRHSKLALANSFRGSSKNQVATDLITEQENFGFTPRVTHGSAHDSGDAESSSELGLVLECPEPACARTFRSVEEMELHLSVGQHTESMYDKLKRGWVEKFSSLTLSEGDSTNVIERQGSEPFQSNLSEGWALHKPKGGAVRFSEKVRQYLTSKFEIGEQSGRKEDPMKVSQDMRKAKGENGERLFSREEWLFLPFVLLEKETGRSVS